MNTLKSNTSQFDNILNFRDVAISINEQQERLILRPGRILRSARPDSASAQDKVKLTDKYGLKTILDLRSKTEHIEAAKKVSASSRSGSDVLEAYKIPSVHYAEVNLNGKGFERHIAWQLSYTNLARLATYMLLGYRLEGISIIGKNVLLPRGLIGLGQDTLEHSRPEVKAVFDLLAKPESYPILIHCTQAISHDYTMSEAELAPEFEDRMKEIRSIGLDESFARCPETFVGEMSQFIDIRYGSAKEYLRSIGIQDGQIDEIRRLVKV